MSDFVFRRAVRRFLRTACEVTCLRTGQHLPATTVDVSWDGAQVALGVPLLTGEDVLLRYRVREVTVSAIGHVVRVIHGRRATDVGRSVGVRFYATGGRARLGQALARVPPTLPTSRVPEGVPRRAQTADSGD